MTRAWHPSPRGAGATCAPAAAQGEPRAAPTGWRRLIGGAAVVLGFGGLAGVYFWPILSGALSLGGDLAAQSYALRLHLTEELSKGRLPQWTPYLGLGFPLLADIEAAAFYPVSLLVSILAGSQLSYRALEVQAVLHYPIAGLGMVLLLCRVGARGAGAVFGGVTFMLSGFLWAHGAHLGIIQSASWGPWVLLGGVCLLERVTWRAVVGTGAALALALLGGHPQVPCYIILALAVTLTVGGWRRRAAPPGAPRPTSLVAWTACALLIAAGLAAVQLLPTAFLAKESLRWNVPGEFLLADRLPLRNLLTLVVPLAFHGTGRWMSVDEFHLYLGILPPVLAAWTLSYRRDRWTWTFAALVALGLVAALGVPGLAWLGTLGFFRAPARAIYLVDLGIAALAGLGVDALLRGPRPDRGRGHRVLLALWMAWLPVGLLGAWLRHRGLPAWLAPGLSPEFPDHYLVFTGFFLASVAAVTLARRLHRIPVLAAAVLLAVLLLDVFGFPRALAWSSIPPTGHWPPRPDLTALSRQLGPQRILGDRVFGRSQTAEANIGLIYRLPLTSVYSSIPLKRQDRLSERLTTTLPRAVNVYDLLAVRYVVAGRGIPPSEAFSRAAAPGGRIQHVEGPLWEVRDPLPRAHLPADIRVVRSQGAVLEALESLDPRQTVLVERPLPGCPPAPLPPPRDSGEVRFLVDQPERVRLAVRVERSRPLVLSDSYYRGWRATVDGSPTPILRANYLFRAVCVPAGDHVVEFRFHPPGFLTGLALTLATGLASLALILGRGGR